MDDSNAADQPLVGRDSSSAAGIVVISAATGSGVSYQVPPTTSAPSHSSPVAVVDSLKNGISGGAAATTK